MLNVMETLSPRQQAILTRVVDTYIETAQPVGSRFITHLYTVLYSNFYSPATVRHEMGLLEEMGYLTHPHTSSGRIPTNQGYRYYVDHSLQEQTLPEEILRQTVCDLSEIREEVGRVAVKTLEILAKLSGEVSLFLVPALASHPDERSSPSLFVQGSGFIVDKPEFQDLRKLKSILEALEEKTGLSQWLRQQTPEAGFGVSIGEENEPAAFKSCSVVSAQCVINGRAGILAVIGPCRMKYSYAIPLVVRMSQVVSRIFDSWREGYWAS